MCVSECVLRERETVCPSLYKVTGSSKWAGYIKYLTDFPGVPVVKTVLPLQRAQVLSLVTELRSHTPYGVAKKIKKGLRCGLTHRHSQTISFDFIGVRFHRHCCCC